MNFYEYTFSVPIDCMICKELEKISDIMEVKIDLKYLEGKYFSYKRGSGDLLVFYKENDYEQFILFDFYRGFSDQSYMATIGVRCNDDIEQDVKGLLISLYKKSGPRSDFVFKLFDELLMSTKKSNYPKIVRDYGDWDNGGYNQNIEIYVDGKIK